MHIYLCIWISVTWCLTRLITEKVGFFLADLLFFRPCNCDLQGCLMHWSSQPPPSAFHLSALHLTRARRSLSSAGRSGEIPRPWEGSLTGHPKSCPSTLLLGFSPFLPLFTWPVHVRHPWLWVQTSHWNLSCTVKFKSAPVPLLLASAVIFDLAGDKKILACKVVNCLKFTCLFWWINRIFCLWYVLSRGEYLADELRHWSVSTISHTCQKKERRKNEKKERKKGYIKAKILWFGKIFPDHLTSATY